MIWGDMAAKHPACISLFPKEVIFWIGDTSRGINLTEMHLRARWPGFPQYSRTSLRLSRQSDDGRYFGGAFAAVEPIRIYTLSDAWKDGNRPEVGSTFTYTSFYSPSVFMLALDLIKSVIRTEICAMYPAFL